MKENFKHYVFCIFCCSLSLNFFSGFKDLNELKKLLIACIKINKQLEKDIKISQNKIEIKDLKKMQRVYKAVNTDFEAKKEIEKKDKKFIEKFLKFEKQYKLIKNIYIVSKALIKILFTLSETVAKVESDFLLKVINSSLEGLPSGSLTGRRYLLPLPRL